MNTFKISKVTIDNFKSIDHLDIEIPNNLMIYADNEVGKSNFASAITWVLTGKNIENQMTFDVVPYGKIGTVNPTVELECLLVEQGRPITLKKQFTAKFTRDKKFSDYKTNCFINGLSVNIGDFNKFINDNICDNDVYKIISTPKTFSEDTPKQNKELQWQAQRRLLMSLLPENILGNDVTLAEQKNDFRQLVEPLKRYGNINSYLTFLKSEKSAVEKSLATFESKIEQQQKNIVEIDTTDVEIGTKIDDLKQELLELENQNSALQKQKSDDRIAELRSQINALNLEKEKLLSKYQAECDDIKDKKTQLQLKLNEIQKNIDTALNLETQYRQRLQQLSNEKILSVCKFCGAPINPETIKRQKADVERRIQKGNALLKNTQQQRLKAKAEYNNIMNEMSSITTPTYPAKVTTINEEIEKLTNSLFDFQQPVCINDYNEKKAAINAKISEIEKKRIVIEQNQKSEQLIADLEAENTANIEKLEKLQYAIDLSKSFVSEKCDILEKNVNDLFTNIKFVLFEKNKTNDDIKEICKFKYNNIEYNELSFSTKLIANLEIVKAFQEKHEICVPIIIDNGETITQEIDSAAQLIILNVQEEKCPECGGSSGRRDTDTGLWTCQKCGNQWKKTMEMKK